MLVTNGQPAAGAVVVSNAGGLSRVEDDGSYVLELELPSDHGPLAVTAIASSQGGTLTARAEVPLPQLGTTTSSGTLLLVSQQTCTVDWIPTFGGTPGTGTLHRPSGFYSSEFPIRALAVWDDGSGPALYVGGLFTGIGGVATHYLARYDGSGWTSLGKALNGKVWCLAAFQGALYVGGEFSSVGSTPSPWITRWDGQAWSAVGAGLVSLVRALVVHDDGSGEALYAGGDFPGAIARWDGMAWSAPGGGPFNGMNNRIQSLAVHDDGSGPQLYAGGLFSIAGGGPASGIARWDGTSWSPLGSGVFHPHSHEVGALLSVPPGSNLEAGLYVGGSFTEAGGHAIAHLARWDGSSWHPVGNSPSSAVWSLLSIEEAGQSVLYAGGQFHSIGGQPALFLGKYDGTAWTEVGGGLNGQVHTLAAYDRGDGQRLYVGGKFHTAGGLETTPGVISAIQIAAWDGASWAGLGSGLDGWARAVAVYDDGTGPALYAGGDFTRARSQVLRGVAKWTGTEWVSVGGGTNGWDAYGNVHALAVYDDGSGEALYAGGNFTTAGGQPANYIAKWNGSAWSPLGSGMAGISPVVYSLAVWDDGTGHALYAAGAFTQAGGVPASRIARWDGTTWSGLGAGVDNTALSLVGVGPHLSGGSALYAGGWFLGAGGHPASRIARWDGTNWSAVGLGLSHVVDCLAAFDDGAGVGPKIYAGGGGTAVYLNAWDGSNWSSIGGLVTVQQPGVLALTVFDDGTGIGPALYVGGNFVGGHFGDNLNLARWDGTNWWFPPFGVHERILGMTVFEDGGSGESSLVVAGRFQSSKGGDSFVARLRGCAQLSEPGTTFCAGDGTAGTCPCLNFGGQGHGCGNSAFPSGARLRALGSASVTADDLSFAVQRSTPGQPGLFFQGNNAVNSGQGTPFGDGLRCAGGNVTRLQVTTTGAQGQASTTVSIAGGGMVSAGDTKRYQWWYRDPGSSPCGQFFNLSNGIEVTWVP